MLANQEQKPVKKICCQWIEIISIVGYLEEYDVHGPENIHKNWILQSEEGFRVG